MEKSSILNKYQPLIELESWRFPLMSEVIRREQRLSESEVFILKQLELGNLSAWELARKSPFGMRVTQAIVEYLLRKKLISSIPTNPENFLQITPQGIDIVNHN